MERFMMSYMRSKALGIQDQLVAWRRDFHQYPELGYLDPIAPAVVSLGSMPMHNHPDRG